MDSKAWIIPLLFFIVAEHGFAGSSNKAITVVRTDRPPTPDGMVDEPQWQNAPAILDFTQFDPNEGARPTEQTSVRILYDDRALYVGVICYDSKPDQIVEQLTRRDRNSESERFTVQIDSYHDHRTAFVFSTNVSGVQSDGVLSQDGTVYDISWDAVWNVKTARYLDGWSAEFEIPFHALRFAKIDNQEYEWGVNFRRYISRKHEMDEWVMIPRSERVAVSRWGHLKGMRQLNPPLHLTVAPYVSSSSTFETARGTKSATSHHTAACGLDLKYGVSRNFTLDATANPDFGQVEVDQAVLNLTVFETLFPEKRPFFVEGSHFFTFGTSVDNTSLPLFFSRRIGRSPTGSASVAAPAGGEVLESPMVTTILGAVKLSGRAESGLSLGVTSALTDEETAIVRDSAGSRVQLRTEPRGSYSVVRVKQELTPTSWIGAIGALASRETMLPALSGGIDWNIRLGEETYAFDGYLGGARSSSATSNRNGVAGRLLFSRISSEHWFTTTSYSLYTRYFNSNDLGFFAQPRDHGGYSELLYKENFASGIFRRYHLALNPEYRWNWDGCLTHANVTGRWYGEFTNFWTATVNYTLDIPAYDDAERGIVGTYRRPVTHTLQTIVKSDESKDISVSLTGTMIRDERIRTTESVLAVLTLRPATWMELTPLFYFERTRKLAAWLFPDGNIIDSSVGSSLFSVFGERDVDEIDLALRGIVTFAPTLSLQFYSQILLARGRYQNYTRLSEGSNLVPYEYRRFAGFYNHDFNQIVLNANVLLRWEFLPGSAAYLVWTQGRLGDSGDYASGFGRRLYDTFSLPHEDVLLLKVSYWLPL